MKRENPVGSRVGKKVKHKILVANRSEIACRIFQACREMGYSTVGIVSPGDEQARHVTYADEVFEVTGYLDIPSILQAAKNSGAEFIHPGYGFLSERPAFARAVEEMGLVFIGPLAETMELMGGKISAKQLATQEKVPTLAWARVSPGEDLKLAAQKVGFPILIKASAGGGGKGMRRVQEARELVSAAESASAEALAAFGDGTLFLEHCVDQPRHIEVQIFGDGKGNGVHLYERECTLQRRHQKIWEEAPAPHLSKQTREGLFEAALKLVRATQFRNAGTMEFLVDGDEKFYFLEMNTRLQVEHPVTEFVTGVDLVCAQIAQAHHPSVSVLKEIPSVRGHAIEVRLYAEDPAQGFIPTPGKILKLRWPTGTGIRVESGIEEGQIVGTQFDSLLAKLIVHAGSRSQAIERLKFALEETVILGIGTNQSFLLALTQHPKVQEGKVDTGFLAREMGQFSPELSPSDLGLIAAFRAACSAARSPASRSEGKNPNESPSFASPWILR